MSITETQSQFFINVPQHDYLNLYDSDEQQHASRVIKFLNLELPELPQATGLPQNQVRSIKDVPKEVVTRLIEIGNICELVAGYFQGNPHKTHLWFTLPNMNLGNISPRDMIRIGRYRKLYRFVTDALAGYSA